MGIFMSYIYPVKVRLWFQAALDFKVPTFIWLKVFEEVYLSSACFSIACEDTIIESRNQVKPFDLAPYKARSYFWLDCH